MSDIRGVVRPARILLVDDSAGDVSLTREALLAGRVANELHVVEDGEQAMDFMHRRGGFSMAPVPDLVLLDLSADERDVLTSYPLHANAYVTKPVEFGEFLVALQQLEMFRLQIVRLPTGTSPAFASPTRRPPSDRDGGTVHQRRCG